MFTGHALRIARTANRGVVTDDRAAIEIVDGGVHQHHAVLAAGLAGIGQGLVGSRAAEGAARNPGAAGTVQTLMIIALALIESLVLFALLIVFVKL